MQQKIWLVFLVILLVGSQINFSQAENKITPKLTNNNDYLIANNQMVIELINTERMTRTEKIDLVYKIAKEEQVNFDELLRIMRLKHIINY